MRNYVMIVGITLLIVELAFVATTALAQQYCVGELSYYNVSVNGKMIGQHENCSLQGAACTPGYGCEPPSSQQPIVAGIVLVGLIFAAYKIWRR